MNKKILAILMALMMVLTSVAAFAADETTTTIPVETSFQLTKTYEGTGKPNETFNFVATTVTEGAPDLTLSATTIENAGTITVTVPEVGEGEGKYPNTPAVYNYTITETAGSTLGTTYDNTVYNVKVTVYNAAEAGSTPEYKTTIAIKAANASTKTDKAAFTNTYANSTKSLVVKKQLAGNAANMEDTFTITVTFGSGVDGKVLNSVIEAAAAGGATVTWDAAHKVATITNIGHNDTVTFTNLPEGTTYAVTETVAGEYTASYDANQNGMMAKADIETVVTNTKTTDIDTGVNTDNMPYIMLMAFVMILAAAVVLKKRTVNE